MEAGADIFLKDVGGWSAIHWAFHNNQSEVFNTLHFYGCRFDGEPSDPREIMDFDEIIEYGKQGLHAAWVDSQKQRNTNNVHSDHQRNQDIATDHHNAAATEGPSSRTGDQHLNSGFGTIDDDFQPFKPFGSDLPSERVPWQQVGRV